MKAVVLPHGAVETGLWIVGSYLQMGDIKKAKHFIQVLKKDAMLAHGTLKTLKMLGEWVIVAMEEHNIPLWPFFRDEFSRIYGDNMHQQDN